MENDQPEPVKAEDREPAEEEPDLVSDIRQQWYGVFALLALAGAAFATYQWFR